ncbi:MAG: hypothetical protein ACPGOV_01780 [Magnetovibrionaceae bacterium]
MTERPEPQFSRGKTILFSCIIIGGFFLLAEVAASFILDSFASTGRFDERKLESRYHPFAGWEPTPDQVVRGPNWSVEVDENGFSRTPYDGQDADYRIVVTGGSTMFGVGSSTFETTVPSLLETILAEKTGKTVDVINLGVRGFQTFQEAMRLREFLLTNRVDLILAVTARNDAFRALSEPGIRSALLTDQVYDNAVPLVRDAELQKPIALNIDGFLRQYSALADLTFRALRRVMNLNAPAASAKSHADPSVIPKRAEEMIKNLAMMEALSEASGSRFAFILQPTAFSLAGYDYTAGHVPLDVQREQADFERAFYAALRERADGISWYDLSGALDGPAETLYIDHTHYNDEGARLLAGEIAVIAEQLLLQTPGLQTPRLQTPRPRLENP